MGHEHQTGQTLLPKEEERKKCENEIMAVTSQWRSKIPGIRDLENLKEVQSLP